MNCEWSLNSYTLPSRFAPKYDKMETIYLEGNALNRILIASYA